MTRWSIRSRLIVSFLLLIVVSLSLLGGYILWYFYQHNVDTLTNNLVTNARIIEHLIKDSMAGPMEKASLDARIKETTSNSNIRITIIDNNGNVLADSWENPTLMENHSDRSEIAAALAGGSGQSIRYSTTLAQNSLYVAIPIVRNSEILGVVRIASTLAQVDAAFSQIRSTLLAAILFTSLLSVALGIKLARNFTAPLEKITRAARRMAGGQLSEKVYINTGDELQLLAHTLNNLSSSLEDKMAQIVAETNKLELILHNMDNAVILLDRYGRITTANKMASEIFDLTPAMLGKHNLHVIGSSFFDQAVHEAIAQNKHQVIDLKTNFDNQKRVFQVFLAPVTAASNDIIRLLAVFHDITALQEINDRQAEFIANASHELSTPLTSIKGFAETLLDGAMNEPELRIKFINIILTEAERMHRLVKDLLQLTKLDSDEYRRQVNLEPVPIMPLITKVAQELKPQAQRKKINVEIAPSSDCIMALAHPDWLKQVLVNLIDNGLKYTPDGGHVHLSCWKEKNQVMIMVKDSGVGIPTQDLPLIFERFYRVDRARNRSAGGTGLGLSIVKFIIDMLGGRIDVQSQVDIGTTFVITLPLADKS
ncbi:Alkaline phosphatase synthesis sensor protein PhoR [bioreactor metagenome]|uniref:histidine kinase n=1 Tax=bioreactor metagenome TaxID=1076179 RepID=A0A644UDK0_9ZZZZ|nr:ATP-binding protein [Negativicutes bacterium]